MSSNGERTSKIPDNVSTEEAASIPLALVTTAISLYSGGSGGLGLAEPWTAEGKGKYTGQPFFIFAGSSSVGQLGEHQLWHYMHR
jgi:NADPH:quinone reductase-like Zn-dependent oxidoreductase